MLAPVIILQQDYGAVLHTSTKYSFSIELLISIPHCQGYVIVLTDVMQGHPSSRHWKMESGSTLFCLIPQFPPSEVRVTAEFIPGEL